MAEGYTGDKIASNSQLREVVDDLFMQKEAGLIELTYEQICERLAKEHGFEVSLPTLIAYRENYYVSIDPELKQQKVDSFRRTFERKNFIVASARSNVDYLNQLVKPFEKLAKRALDEIEASKGEDGKGEMDRKQVEILDRLVDKILLIKDSILKQTKGLTVEELLEKTIAECGDICLDVFTPYVAESERKVLMDKFKVKLEAYYLRVISTQEPEDELRSRGKKVGRPSKV